MKDLPEKEDKNERLTDHR